MMKSLDLLNNWKEPTGVSDWGSACQPPISPAWNYYINVNIHPDDMIVLFRVIFPAFIEVDDCVLLKMNADGHSESNLLNFRKQARNSKIFEKQFNTFKIYDLFSHKEVEHESSFEQAAMLLEKSWGFALKALYPEKVFEIMVSNTDRDYGPTLTFYSI